MKLWKASIGLFLGLITILPTASADSKDWMKVDIRLQNKEFVSDIKKTDEFTGFIYDVDLVQSPDDFIIGGVQFLNKDGSWTDWIQLANDEHSITEQSVVVDKRWENLINTNPAFGYRFKFNLRAGADSVLPAVLVKDVETIDSKKIGNSIVSSISDLAGNPFSRPGVKVISRAEWGADDSLNIAEEYEDEDWEALALFKENEYVDKVVHEVDGELLKWPLEYTNDIKFLAVHHTVSAGELEDSAQAVRNIQRYHAVQRGWGDIGYHYLIDKKGNIYEGRAGGEMVIGGHSREINKVSIGIALIGNFQENNPPEAMMQSLISLLEEKADYYNLDVSGVDNYDGNSYPVLGGHSDYSATACPGVHNYQLLRALRGMVDNNEDNLEILKLTNTGTDVESGFGNFRNINLSVKNTSGMDWDKKNTKLVVTKAPKGLTSSPRLILDTKNGSNATFQLGISGSAVSSGIYDIEANIEHKGKVLNKRPIMMSANVFSVVEEVQEVAPVKTVTQTQSGNKSSNDKPRFGNPFFNFNKSGSSSSSNSSKSMTKTSTFVKPVVPKASQPVQVKPALETKEYSKDMPEVRIHISGFNLPKGVISANSTADIIVDGKKVDNLALGEKLIVWKSGNVLKAGVGTKRWDGEVVALDGEVLTVENYEKRPAWSKTINDNRFRGRLDFRIESDGLMMVNQLGMEPYLMGLAEVPDSDEYEKAKTIVTAARSYIYYYSVGPGAGKKFPGKPYDIDDSPARSQKYLGYGFEERSNLNKKAVQETEGEIITWNGNSVVIPYFSQSDGRTRSAAEVWGWSNDRAGYLLGVDDTFCKGGEGKLWGHGVGISGCGATEMASRGFDYEDIIDYYLEGVKVVEKY